jgi:hypothetical protein
MIRAALDDVGLAFMSEEFATPHLSNGALVHVLQDLVPGLLPLLPEPAAAASRALGSNQHCSPIARK